MAPEKTFLAGLLLVICSCDSAKTASNAVASSTTPSSAFPTTADNGEYVDSVLGTARGDEMIVTAKGDTIQWLGGALFEFDPTSQYGAEEYRVNGVHFLRVVRTIGHRPNGIPVNRTKGRVRLPAMDSTEELLLTGLCRVNGKDDPRVTAIAFVANDSTYAPARHAWRFDLATEKLTELPVRGITCTHIVGDD